MGKCRCVSKLWSSTIRRPNNNQLFPGIKSPATPRLLVAIKDGEELFFFSSPQPQNPHGKVSLVATRHHTISLANSYRLCSPVGALVFLQPTGKSCKGAVIFNPVTGESVSVATPPKQPMEEDPSKTNYYFGYDPIDKQFKVLSISRECQVLTVETGNLLWRKIQCCNPAYCPQSDDDGICINGAVYYTAFDYARMIHLIVCFDVRSEKFSYINIDPHLETMLGLAYSVPCMILIDYEGKLGAITEFKTLDNVIELWVLQEAKEHKWSKHIYEIPSLKFILPYTTVGVTGRGQFVFYPKTVEGGRPYRSYYYNPEKKLEAKVKLEIPRPRDFDKPAVYTFSNYLEDVKLI